MHLVRLADGYRRAGKRQLALEAYVLAATVFLRGDRPNHASAACRAALSIDADDAAARALLERLVARRGPPPPPRPDAPAPAIRSAVAAGKPADPGEPAAPAKDAPAGPFDWLFAGSASQPENRPPARPMRLAPI